MADRIDKFRGEYAFLSNFFPCYVQYEGLDYPSVEHAFQAAKSLDLEVRRGMQVCPSPADAKYCGRRLKLRPDWEQIKIQVMRDLVKDKFTRNLSTVDIKKLLLETGDAYLEEGNHHRDTFWGTVDGKGQNWLGKILMEVREELKVTA